jgi:hypothetical protein
VGLGLVTAIALVARLILPTLGKEVETISGWLLLDKNK